MRTRRRQAIEHSLAAPLWRACQEDSTALFNRLEVGLASASPVDIDHALCCCGESPRRMAWIQSFTPGSTVVTSISSKVRPAIHSAASSGVFLSFLSMTVPFGCLAEYFFCLLAVAPSYMHIMISWLCHFHLDLREQITTAIFCSSLPFSFSQCMK